MHLGNIYTALLSWLCAKRDGGRWLLRIEDLDPQRSRREYALQAMEDLQWLGLSWDDEPLWQSERTEVYAEHFRLLQEQGHLYPCYCTRADILNAANAPHEADGRVIYPGTCRPKGQVAKGEGPLTLKSKAPAWRVTVPDEDISFTDAVYGPQTFNLARHCGDFIVRRADGTFAYQLAVVVDDALSGITQVVRGRDLLLSAAQQIYLYSLLGYAPPSFAHLPLLCNTAGQRLSKRDTATHFGQLKQTFTPRQLTGHIAYIAGLTPTVDALPLSDLLLTFDVHRLPSDDITVSCSDDALTRRE